MPSLKSKKLPERRALEPDTGRSRLLSATADLMIELDTIDIPLSLIAKRASCNQALVNYHFGSKEGLLIALFERDAAKAVQRLETLIAMDLPATEKLKLHIAGVIKTYSQVPYWTRLMHALLRDASEEKAQTVSAFIVRPVAEFHKALIKQGVAEGLFKPMDPMFFHFCIMGACDHLFSSRASLLYGFGKKTIDQTMLNAFVQQVTDLVLNGLLVKQPVSKAKKPPL